MAKIAEPNENFSKILESIEVLQQIPGVIVHGAISSHYFFVSDDRLKLKLGKYEKSVTSRNGIVSNLIILITLIIALNSANFKEWWGLNENWWKFLFQAGSVLAFVFMIMSIGYYAKNRTNVNKIIDELKNEE